MKILVVSDYLLQGGAAVACNRLCTALAAQPSTEVHRFAFTPCSNPGRIGFPHTQGTGWRVESLLQALAGSLPASFLLSARRQIAARRLRRLISDFQPDVINLHNLHGYDFGLTSLAALVDKLPLVWTLHDMWSFTGRCAYAYDCVKFASGTCDTTCPTPAEFPALAPARIAPALARKRSFIQGRPRTGAACPSSWLATAARQGLWAGQPVENIPNGLPLDVFHPVDKRAARAALGLPLDGLLGIMAADYLVERRKGGDMIAQALSLARRPDFGLLTMGHSHGLALEGVRMHPLGFVSDDTVKRLAYSAADVLIHPAPVDNLPNTVVEALACGTPTVAFRTGGLPELVQPDETGWLCPTMGAQSLGAQLQEALRQLAGGLSLSAACRRRAQLNHDDAGMARRYLALFEQLRT